MDVTHDELVMNDVAVQTELAENLPLIQGDRVQLQKVMLNLIDRTSWAGCSVPGDPQKWDTSSGHISTYVESHRLLSRHPEPSLRRRRCGGNRPRCDQPL